MDPLRSRQPAGEPSGHARSLSVSFVSFGVGVTVESSSAAHMEWIQSRLRSLLAGHVEPADGRTIHHTFAIHDGPDGLVTLFQDGEEIGANPSATVALQYLGARIKLTVGESTQTHVLVHAGVVAFGSRAVVLPGHSFQGKTTLVRALLARGGTYYSDDLAVFDRDGLVHPFPKTLSLRGITSEYEQVEHTVESLGGVAGEGPRRVGLLLFTSFAADGEWSPQTISPGLALLKLTEHTRSIRTDPQRSMEILSKVVHGGAVLWASPRRDSADTADAIVERLQQIVAAERLC